MTTEERLLPALILIGLALIILTGMIHMTCAPTETETELYANCGTVTAIDRENDSVTFTDSTGHAWMFSGAEDWMVGDTVAAIMNDNGTANVTDDIIVSVRYCG